MFQNFAKPLLESNFEYFHFWSRANIHFNLFNIQNKDSFVVAPMHQYQKLSRMLVNL